MKQNREKWLDALRGLAMLLVIWGHCGKNLFFNAIYLVNVPLFICVTGFINGIKFSDCEKITKADYIKILKHYVYPYLTYGILYEACSYVNGLIGLKLFGTISDARLHTIVLNFFLFEAGTIWFLIPLAVAEFSYFILLTGLNIVWKGKVRNIVKYLFICLLSIGLVGMVGLINPQKFFPQNNGIIMECLKHWHYMIQRSFAFVFFLAFGSFCHSVIKDKILNITKQVILCGICLTIFCMKYTSETWAFTEVRHLSDYNQLRYFLMSSTICFPLFLLFSHANNHLKFLQYIGRNTLIINGTHLTLNIVEIMNRWCRRCFVNLSSPILITLLVMILTVIMEITVIIPIFHGSLRFMDDSEVIIGKIKSLKK